MRRHTSLALFLAITTLAGVASAQELDTEGEVRMLDSINALRAENQLAPLSRMDTLDAVARGHAAEMASNHQLAHVSSTTGTPEDRVRGAGVPAGRIAENVATHTTTASAQDALFASAAHRANILHPDVTHVGLGSVQTERGVYVAQVFAGGLPAPVAAAPPEPTLEAGDDESRFALIPPFIERMAEQVAAPVLAQAESLGDAVGAPAMATIPMTPIAPPTSDSPSAPEVESAPAAAPGISVPGIIAPGITAPQAAEAAPNANITPGAANTLRELIGLGLSILGGASR